MRGWQRSSVAADDRALQTTIEAQVAAASLGYKPLFFEPLGGQLGARLAARLRRALPAEVVVAADEIGLFVYRPEAVRPILDADPGFYRPTGEDDLRAISGVSAIGQNGELLGYGARNWSVPHGARVRISNEQHVLFMFFVSDPAHAQAFARARLRDIATYTGEPLVYDITLAR